MANRVALVIGNGNYTEAGFLKNPANDATAISAALTDFGFHIIGGPRDGIDLDYGKFAARIRDFGRNLKEASVALLFYAGHGLQVAGRNYLVPVDAALEQEADVGLELIELQHILNQMERPDRTTIVILDACRNNPLARNLARAMGIDMRAAGITEGLAEQKVVAGTLIAFGTQPGHVAYDGAGQNGYFTEALLEQLQLNADREVELLFKDVRARVLSETKTKAQGPQVPWVHSSLIGSFSFAAPKSQPDVAVTAPPAAARPAGTLDWSASSAEWERIKDSTDAARLKLFAEHAHPYHATLARDRVRLMEAEAQKRAEAERERKAEEQRRRAEGRIEVDAPIVTNPQGRWFLPGAGKTESFKDIDVGPKMVVVPAGSFMMGSPESEPGREGVNKGSETPQHKVTIAKPFAIGRHAITRGEFAAFVNATGHKTDGGAYVWNGKEWKLDPAKSWRDPGFAQDDRHPVVCVSWEDAQAYTKWLSQKTGKTYRLPSEAGWEYVCRAGTTTPFWWGSSITPAQANYDGNYTYAGGGSKGEYRQRTVPVDSFQANPWGLCQVHGNVWEWCEDSWNENYNGAPTDGSAWTTGGGSRRVLRGGSWYYGPQFLRAAFRYWFTTVYRGDVSGFRLARTLNL